MLKTFALRGREVPLTLHGPSGLRELLAGLRRVFGNLTFPLETVELRPGDVIERAGYAIRTFAVDHGPNALGYLVSEAPRPGRFDVAVADSLGVPPGRERGMLQRGEAVVLDNGATVRPEQVLGPARPGRSLALTGDTAPSASVVDAVAGVDLLVHEATFCADERGPRPRDEALDGGRGRSRGASSRRAPAGPHAHLEPLFRRRGSRRGAPALPRDRRAARLRHDRDPVPRARRARPRSTRRPAWTGAGRFRLVSGGRPDFGARARVYDSLRPADEAWWEAFAALVELCDLTGRRVLDVGCGTGRLAAALVE